MKHLLGGVLAAGSLLIAIGAFAQSTATSNPPPGEASTSSTSPVVQTVTGAAAPVNPSRRFACRAGAEKYKGQDRVDQMQLCMAQARLDCLKQAIDQKVVGPRRRDFVQDCVGE